MCDGSSVHSFGDPSRRIYKYSTFRLGETSMTVATRTCCALRTALHPSHRATNSVLSGAVGRRTSRCRKAAAVAAVLLAHHSEQVVGVPQEGHRGNNQRIAKGAGGKGPRQKTSKNVKKSQKAVRHFSTIFTQSKKSQKSSKFGGSEIRAN